MNPSRPTATGALTAITLVSVLGGALALSCCKSEIPPPDPAKDSPSVGRDGMAKPKGPASPSPDPTKETEPATMTTDNSVVPRDDLPTTEAEWRARLEKTLAEASDTDLAYRVTREKGTERAFTGLYWDDKRAGEYRCRCCNQKLFDSSTKFKSGTGWPSFWAPAAKENVTEESDGAHGMVRTEVLCSNCGAHLGHVFPDGPKPTGQRYCINSISLKLTPRE